MSYLGLIDIFSLGGKSSKSPALLFLWGSGLFVPTESKAESHYLNLLNREEEKRREKGERSKWRSK